VPALARHPLLELPEARVLELPEALLEDDAVVRFEGSAPVMHVLARRPGGALSRLIALVVDGALVGAVLETLQRSSVPHIEGGGGVERLPEVCRISVRRLEVRGSEDRQGLARSLDLAKGGAAVCRMPRQGRLPHAQARSGAREGTEEGISRWEVAHVAACLGLVDTWSLSQSARVVLTPDPPKSLVHLKSNCHQRDFKEGANKSFFPMS